jgi:TrmH family RNA methyltransferase
MLPPRKLAEHLPGILRDGDVALVFGREDKGLANDELALCNMGVHIPTAADYPSLNLSHAVMVVAYECFYAVLSVAEPDAENTEPTYPAVAALAERVCGLTERTGFIHRRGRVGFERSLRQTIQRSGINTRDLTLVHLVCRHLERYMGGLERGLTPEEARAAQSEDVERESGGTSD